MFPPFLSQLKRTLSRARVTVPKTVRLYEASV